MLEQPALPWANVGITAKSQVAASPFPTPVLRIRTQLEQSQLLTDMAVPDSKSRRVRDPSAATGGRGRLQPFPAPEAHDVFGAERVAEVARL